MSINSKVDFEPLLNALKPLYGPNGGVLVQQNATGGPKCLTRFSSKLFLHLSTHEPLRKVALSALTQHALKWHDGSTMTGIMICLLHKMFTTTEPQVHPRLFSNVLSWIMQHSTKALQNPDFSARFEITVPHITAILQSTIRSKHLPIIHDECFIANIVHKLARVFVTLGGENVEDSLNIITRRKLSNYVEVFDGVMIDSEHSVHILPPDNYRTVLISCSLSGDTEEAILDLKYQSELSLYDMEQFMIEKIRKLLLELKSRGVDLVVCQKVIHPKIKQYLYSINVLYLERLGEEKINKLNTMTSYRCISSIIGDSEEFSRTPTLISCQHISRQHKHQLKVDLLLSCKNLHQPVLTLEITHWNEHTLNDMKIMVQQSLKVLRTVIHNPVLLPGAGIWQKNLSYILMKKCKEEDADVIRKLGASPALFRNLVNEYCAILLKLSHCLNSSDDIHSEVIPPSLTVFNPNMIWDVSITQITSLNTAIDVVKAIISIAHVIECM